MGISEKLYNVQNFWFNVFIALTYTTYALLTFGIFSTSPEYLRVLDNYVKIYISMFLLWRFNPFRQIEFTDLDRKIAFSAGMFLFTTSAVNQILMKYLDNAENIVQYNIQKQLNNKNN